jgi:membrane protein involved in colicin uptake
VQKYIFFRLQKPTFSLLHSNKRPCLQAHDAGDLRPWELKQKPWELKQKRLALHAHAAAASAPPRHHAHSDAHAHARAHAHAQLPGRARALPVVNREGHSHCSKPAVAPSASAAAAAAFSAPAPSALVECTRGTDGGNCGDLFDCLMAHSFRGAAEAEARRQTQEAAKRQQDEVGAMIVSYSFVLLTLIRSLFILLSLIFLTLIFLTLIFLTRIFLTL